MNNGAGIDLVEVARFKSLCSKSKQYLLQKFFTEQELAYCFSFKDPAPHLAGLFAAKEAASKALGVHEFPFIELEVRHTAEGAPEIWHEGNVLAIRISITHTKAMAAAVAVS